MGDLKKKSRDIPLPVRRQLRKESGFGCCICGHPFIEYHHIAPFNEDPHHRPEDMIALCPNHHHQADIGAITVGKIRKVKKAPYNIENDKAEGQFLSPSTILAVSAGSNLLVGLGFKLLGDNLPLLGLRAGEDGQLLVSLSLKDNEDKSLIELKDNEWISGDPLPWDFEYSYNRIVLRNNHRDIRLDLDARDEIVKIRGKFYHCGQMFEISPKELRLNNKKAMLSVSNLGVVSMQFVINTKKGAIEIRPNPIIGNGQFISEATEETLLEKSLKAHRKQLASIKRNDRCPCESGLKWKKCCKSRI